MPPTPDDPHSANVYALEDATVSVFIVVYGVLLALGTIVTALFILAMHRGTKVLRLWPFYSIVQSLMSLDAIYLVFQLSFVFPSMVPGDVANVTTDVNATISDADAWYNSQIIHSIRSVFDFLPSKGLLYLTLLMTLNRLAVFVFPSMRVIFTKRNVLFSLLACWMFILLQCILCVLVRPTLQFNRKLLRFEDNGDVVMSAPWLRSILDYSDYVVPTVTLLIYAAIYWSIRQKRRVISSATLSLENSHAKQADDKRMLLQAIVICLFQELYNIVNFTGANIVNEEQGIWDYVLNMFTLILSVTNHSIHSTIFIVTNPTIRGFLPRPRCGKGRSKARPRSISPIKT